MLSRKNFEVAFRILPVSGPGGFGRAVRAVVRVGNPERRPHLQLTPLHAAHPARSRLVSFPSEEATTRGPTLRVRRHAAFETEPDARQLSLALAYRWRDDDAAEEMLASDQRHPLAPDATAQTYRLTVAALSSTARTTGPASTPASIGAPSNSLVNAARRRVASCESSNARSAGGRCARALAASWLSSTAPAVPIALWGAREISHPTKCASAVSVESGVAAWFSLHMDEWRDRTRGKRRKQRAIRICTDSLPRGVRA